MTPQDATPTRNGRPGPPTTLSEETARLVAAHPGLHAYAFEESGQYGVELVRYGLGRGAATISLPVRFTRPAAAIRLCRLINGEET